MLQNVDVPGKLPLITRFARLLLGAQKAARSSTGQCLAAPVFLGHQCLGNGLSGRVLGVVVNFRVLQSIGSCIHKLLLFGLL